MNNSYRLRIATRESFGTYFREIPAFSYDEAFNTAASISMEENVESVRVFHKPADHKFLWNCRGDFVNGAWNPMTAYYY